jgi:hypothetical protein
MRISASLDELIPESSAYFQEIIHGMLFGEKTSYWQEYVAAMYERARDAGESDVELIRAYVRDGTVFFETQRHRNGVEVLFTADAGPAPGYGENLHWEMLFSTTRA